MLPLTNSKDCVTYLRNIWEYNTISYEERVYVVFLNSQGVRMDFKVLDQGLYSECEIKPKQRLKIVQKAIKLKSKFIVLAHNHPCGDPTPSENDICITDKLITVLGDLDIRLIDHIILTENSYYSFKDNNLLRSKK